jgi:hypothetical protein
MDPTDKEAKRDSHAATVKKILNKWYVFDSFYNNPINLDDWKEASEWIKSIEYIDIFKMEEYRYQPQKVQE